MTTAAAISRTRTITLHTLIALTLAFFALAASSPAWADPPGRVGRIADTQGKVWLFEDEQGEWVQAQRNRPMTAGDRLSAERGARAEVQVGSGTLRLDGGADVEFTQLDDARVHMRVLGGSVALRVRGSRLGARVRAAHRRRPLRAAAARPLPRRCRRAQQRWRNVQRRDAFRGARQRARDSPTASAPSSGRSAVSPTTPGPASATTASANGWRAKTVRKMRAIATAMSPQR